jgi:cation diffusion facilitator family transporter
MCIIAGTMNLPAKPSPSEKQTVAFYSLLASLVLTIVKFAAAIFTASLALLSEAFHSLIDFGATVMTLLAVRWADRPADEDHHYGHAKIESIAALAASALLVGMAITFGWEALKRLWGNQHHATFSWWVVALLIASIIVDYNRSQALARVATQSTSAALAADALHFSTDMWSSAAILAGFLGIWAGFGWADSVATLLVSGFILLAAFRLGKETLAILLDAAPAGASTHLRNICENATGVLNVVQLRARPAGPTLFVSVVVELARTLPVQEIIVVKDELTRDILAAYPHADITITANLVELNSESAFDKVKLIAAHRGLAIHHLTVQRITDRLAVSFDVEVDGDLPLDKAHDIVTQLEAEIRDSLGENVEVESHIEPLPSTFLEGVEVDEKLRARLHRSLSQLAGKLERISEIHNVRARQLEAGLFVHYHCRFDRREQVNDVHEIVDLLEQRFKSRHQGILRVVAHAEPLGTRTHRL